MLSEYWLDELDAASEARVEEHLLGRACSRELEELAALATGMRQPCARAAHGGIECLVRRFASRDCAYANTTCHITAA
jgi:hypothetical protein